MKSPYSYHVEPFDLKDRPKRFLEAFAAILKNSNYGLVLDTFARTTTKCGRCAVACPTYDQTRDTKHHPCNRSEMVLKVYRRYFTFGGMVKARFGGTFELTDEYIDEMAEMLYQCTACRRCPKYCPMGIDHGLITHLGRWVLAELNMIPKALLVSVREQVQGETHNTSAIPLPALKDTCEFLEEELMETYGHPIKFPMDVDGADMVFFPAVSDYLLEADTLMGNAAVMYATNTSWTIGSKYYDGINYGLFYSDRMWDKIVGTLVEQVKMLNAKTILIGECGHASRSAKVGVPNFHNSPDMPPVINCIEYAWRMIQEGRLKVKKAAIKERVTYHDPCNYARSGWIVDPPREILKIICEDFVEMTPNREHNLCCGGGGGTVSIDEIRKFRTGPMGKKKADQLRATGAKYVIAPCANCKKQLGEVIDDNEVEGLEVTGLHDLLIKAIDFGPAPEGAKKEDEPADKPEDK